MKSSLVNCPLCGKKDEKEVCSLNDLRIVRCVICGLTYQSPREDFESPERLNTYGVFNNDNKEDIERFYGLILSMIVRYKKGGKLLDVGCAKGDFLKVARDKGFDTAGVEISNKNAEFAGRYGEIFNGILQDAGYSAGLFDVIVMRHVFEHIPDPESVLEEVSRILKPGGLFYIEVPNDRYLRTKILLFSRLNPNFIDGIKSHLFYYNMRTFDKMLQCVKFIKIERGFWGFSNRIFAEHSISKEKRKNCIVKIALAIINATKIDVLFDFQDSMYQILEK